MELNNQRTKTDAAEGGDRDTELFVEMIGYSGRDLHWSYQQNKDDDEPRKASW